jgi:2-oxoisovalerate dehydrogenase E1 component
MNFKRKQLSDSLLLQLYEGLLKPRLIEEKMLILLRQNKISKWFSGIGQEAIAVGLTMALDQDEFILPMHLWDIRKAEIALFISGHRSITLWG